MGRHTAEDVFRIGIQDLGAIADYLGYGLPVGYHRCAMRTLTPPLRLVAVSGCASASRLEARGSTLDGEVAARPEPAPEGIE